jgi:glutamate/tyrosine decarboxylase-like PLP-dependent enzyme
MSGSDDDPVRAAAVAAAVRAAETCRSDMHHYDDTIAAFAQQVLRFALRRTSADAVAGGIELGHPRSKSDLDALAGETITPGGLGQEATLDLFERVLEPACLSVDFPRYLAFVPAAPTETAILGDLIVSACSIYAGSWLEGGGAVWAENEALRYLARLARLPEEAGGCFVSGGTVGNLSALVAARTAAETAGGGAPLARWAVVTGASGHSSLATAAHVMGAELVVVEPGRDGRLTGAALAPVLAAHRGRVCAVVATAGSTNIGVVDDLASVADACAAEGVWLHVDAAYGGAAMAAPSARWRFDGIERADSLIVDPHKWLFAPFDACALLYRDPPQARAAHAQHAAYLDVLTSSDDWNPSDYAIHLSRRARGLPFWFSLAAYGTNAYSDAVEACLATARAAAELVKAADHLDLVREPELSVVMFRRRGWDAEQHLAWSKRMLDAGTAFVVPSTHEGAAVLRICIVNPRTSVDDIRVILDSLA